MLGISEEQHGDRTRLFMQWQQMDWPVLIDSLNLLEVSAVPITLLVDPSGVIRYRNPADADLEAFLATDYPRNPASEPVVWKQDLKRAVAAVNSGDPSEITAAIQTFRDITEKSPRQWFHSGVLLRKRFDSPDAETDDFANAITSWSTALAGDPGQYIWRRRIQQYGPRLDKPYPFYDWIPEARATIERRHEQPVALVAEPSGAEYAAPATVAGTPNELLHPDPENRLPDDSKELLSVAAVAVPSTDAKKPGWRIHLTFSPNVQSDAHWNNESGPMLISLDRSHDWITPNGIRILEIAADPIVLNSATSSEARHAEFEIVPSDRHTSIGTLSGNAYVYLCEGASGTCTYIRKPFTVRIPPILSN